METVRFRHFRASTPQFKAFLQALSLERSSMEAPKTTPNCGGVVTECTITEDLGQDIPPMVVIGHSFCKKKDQFNKAFGRTIAEGRARKHLILAKTTKPSGDLDD